jgi:hypothetical protein
VVQGALKLILEPVFEADFQPGSYGYRPKRTAHGAIHVSSEASELVLAGAARAASARVVAENRYTPASARNVVVTIRGTRRSSPPSRGYDAT